MLLKQKKPLPLLEVESQFLGHPAHSLTTTMTVLSQIHKYKNTITNFQCCSKKQLRHRTITILTYFIHNWVNSSIDDKSDDNHSLCWLKYFHTVISTSDRRWQMTEDLDCNNHLMCDNSVPDII
jgi:hypothetical protein